jgi:hypothetical protein
MSAEIGCDPDDETTHILGSNPSSHDYATNAVQRGSCERNNLNVVDVGLCKLSNAPHIQSLGGPSAYAVI